MYIYILRFRRSGGRVVINEYNCYAFVQQQSIITLEKPRYIAACTENIAFTLIIIDDVFLTFFYILSEAVHYYWRSFKIKNLTLSEINVLVFFNNLFFYFFFVSFNTLFLIFISTIQNHIFLVFNIRLYHRTSSKPLYVL